MYIYLYFWIGWICKVIIGQVCPHLDNKYIHTYRLKLFKLLKLLKLLLKFHEHCAAAIKKGNEILGLI